MKVQGSAQKDIEGMRIIAIEVKGLE